MRITVGDAVYQDGDLPLGELMARYDEGVATSAPAPGDFLRVLDTAPGEVLVLTVSQRLSSTAASARLAADTVGSRVRVIDSGTSAGSLALIALHAARTAQAGGTMAEVEGAARCAISRARLVAAVGTLDYLVRGGRLPEAVGGLGSRIGLRPMVEVVNDRGVRALRPAFSKHAADERMIKMLLRSRVAGARLHVAALHVLAEEQAHALLAAVRAEVAPATELVARFGASMVVHTGPHLTGLSWWWE
jgi:DegV family protein with EDD domain